MARWLFVPLVAAHLMAAPLPQAVEIDRTLEHVYTTPIMASDVRQAKLLGLLPDAGTTDDRVLTAIENRVLLLREASRQVATQPSSVAIAARRKTLTASWPAGTDVTALMAKAGMSDQALDGWCRDDLRIAAYLDLRFGVTADQARATRLAEWISELRRRANLSDRR